MSSVVKDGVIIIEPGATPAELRANFEFSDPSDMSLRPAQPCRNWERTCGNPCTIHSIQQRNNDGDTFGDELRPHPSL